MEDNGSFAEVSKNLTMDIEIILLDPSK